MVTLPLGGPHTITLVVNDGTVDSDPDTVDITVVDTIAPSITALWDIDLSPGTLNAPFRELSPLTFIELIS